MTRPVVIVDTNIVVAALLTQHDGSPVARVLNAMLAAAFSFVVSAALLAECRAVLVRPKLRKLHGLAVAEINAVPTDIAQHAIVLQPFAARAAPDPRDALRSRRTAHAHCLPSAHANPRQTTP